MQKIIRYFLIVLIFFNFIYVLSGVLNYQVQSIDVFGIWLLKAKLFFYNNGFNFDLLKIYKYSHPHYPILLPLLFFNIFNIVGEFKELWVLLIYPFLYLLILFFAYKVFIKVGIGKNLSIFLVYVYSMLSPLLSQAGRMHAGEADIFITFLSWIIIILILKMKDEKNISYHFILITLIVICSQIKQEGVFLSYLFLFLPIEKKKRYLLILISVIPSFIWHILRINAGVYSDFGYFIPSIYELFLRFINIVYLVTFEMLNFRNWYLFWVIFWILQFLIKTESKIISNIIIPYLLICSASIFIFYLFSTLDPGNYVVSSIDRIMLQMSPFILLIFSEKTKLLLDKIK